MQGQTGIAASSETQDFDSLLSSESESARPLQIAEVGSDGVARPIVSAVDELISEAGADGNISEAELLLFRQKHGEEARDLLNGTLANLGIKAQGKIGVETDRYGQVRVSGQGLSELDRKKLETALNNNPAFVHASAAASEAATVLEECKQNAAFGEAYAKNPFEACKSFKWLFGAKWHAVMNFDAGAVDYSVSTLP